MERRQTMEEKEEEEAEDKEYFECIIEEIQRKPSAAKEMPQPIIVKYHDILDRLWGWHKLLPMGESVSWADYSAYLKGYLSHNSDAIRSITALAQTCLDSEEKLVSEWNIKAGSEETWSMRKSNILSCLIHECVRSFIDAGCSFSDVSGAALLCIAKEADLTRELLKHGVDPVDDYLIDQGKEIRMCALGLMNCTLDKNSVAASALMLGMAKEAETMIAWIIKNDKPVDLFHYSISDEIEDSRIVRYRTLNVMIDILEEFSSAAACHKIDKKEPASRNGPVGDGDGFAAHGAANSTGGSISDVLNSQYKKNMEGGKMSKKRKMKEEGHLENVWGWERLLPLCGSVKSSGHSSYLEEYYIRNADEFFAAAAANQNPEDSQITTNADMGAAVAKFCLKMEEVLLSEWNTRVERSLDDTLPLSTIIQSSLIKELALSICSTGGDLSIVAFVCITKEADLMCELLKHGAKPFDYMIQQSSMIRTCALGLANLKRNQSTVPAAAMVGMANEAKMMCDWMKREKKLVTFGSGKPNDELEACRLIRVKALDVMTSILQESYFPSSKMPDDDAMSCN